MSDLISRGCLKEYRTEQSDTMFEKGWNSAITAIYKTAKSATIEDGFINKPCVSEQACHEDKMKVLEKIRAEIEASRWTNKDIRIERNALASGLDKALEIIDKHMAESEDKECRS